MTSSWPLLSLGTLEDKEQEDRRVSGVGAGAGEEQEQVLEQEQEGRMVSALHQRKVELP